MITTLLAVNCPAIQQRGSFLRVLDAPTFTNGNAPVSENMTTGTGSNFRLDTIRPHATRLDLLSGYGGANANCILSGSNLGNELVLVAPGGGLTLTIRAGHANVGGLVEVAATSLLAVPDATARVWVWLQQNGTLSYTTTTAPPSSPSCLIGSCVTSGGNITAVDNSGVLYLQAGVLWRNTADAGAPTDSPPVSVAGLKTLNPFCTYEWDGVGHRQMYMPIRTSDPASPQNGDIWFRTDTGYAGTRIQTAGGILTGTGATAPM